MISKPQDAYIQVDQVEWQDFPAKYHTGGVKWKLLNVAPDLGFWTVLYFCPKDSVLTSHIHHGPAEGWIFDGVLELRGGPENGGSLCIKNGFLYEANGAKHEETKMLEDTTFILQMIGPLTWILKDGTQDLQTWEDALNLWEEQTSRKAG